MGDNVSGEVVGEAYKANNIEGSGGVTNNTGGGVNTNDTVGVGGSSSNDLPVAALP